MAIPAVITGQGDYTRSWPTPLSIEGQELLTHSRMQAFKTCPRMHYYAYLLGVRREETSRPLRFGSAIHLGLDKYRQGHDIADCIIAAAAGYDTPPKWVDSAETRHEWEVEREQVSRLLAGYAWRWGVQGLDPSINIVESIASEQAFQIDITNPSTGSPSRTFSLAGKIDGVVRLQDGRIAVHEVKTASDDLGPDSEYWLRLMVDTQISGYIHAARTLGHDVRTVLYDVIRKPTIKPKQVPIVDEQGTKIVVDINTGERVRTKDGKKWRESGSAEQGLVLQSRVQTPEEYGEDLTTDIMARPDWYYARREIPRLSNDIEDFQHELWQIAQQMRESQNNGRHFRNTGACTQFNRACVYLSHCHSGLEPNNPPSGFVRVSNVHQELTT